MVRTTSSARFRATISAFLCVLACALVLAPGAFADDAGATGNTGQTGATDTAGSTGSVGELSVDPTVQIARQTRCFSRTVVINPSYAGGGGLVKSYLFVNGRQVGYKTAAGSFSAGARKFKRGRNAYEVVSIFANGKSASQVGSFTRCGAKKKSKRS